MNGFRQDSSQYRRVVVKIGTSNLTQGSAAINRDQIGRYADQIAALLGADIQAMVVTSGARAAGLERLNTGPDTAATHTKQVLTSIGQARLAGYWDQAFAAHGVLVGQILLTRHEIEDSVSYLNIQDTLGALLERRIVPIINENDVVATSRLKVGDNDSIAAMVAVMMQADLLLILTETDGLYSKDPSRHPDAEHLKTVPVVDGRIRAMAGDTSTDQGTGGMTTKLEAAQRAQRAGVDTIIADGARDRIVPRIVLDREELGTLVPGLGNLLQNRQRRILTAVPAGTIQVDMGARNALVNRGTSLLPAGIKGVDGSFRRGETVRLSLLDGQEFARGISRYASAELEVIKGVQSSQIASLLGYDYGAEAIHRNDLILI
ncbi:MAG: glutamate 5-kinase [Caldilineaceae bacterium SB0662_bin_9]|uniref:Glutamate 5-kinase n=1 Tax=Caldilineaceae bacterium SB0662_bin_9 TaxID=2605258 RepID=A0A6B1DT23_9CHLR|nr:glutamate 5-kinase [Caldilineaceae bacterium SB0662_bin_9]